MQVKCFFLTLVVLSTFFPLSFAQAQRPIERPIVRLIYFLPRDRHTQPDINQKMDTLIKGVQKFYADQMEMHGFGRKTFQIETDATGNAIVHHVVGQFTNWHYNNLSNTWDVWGEILERFDTSKNIYLTAIDISGEALDGGLIFFDGSRICGKGGARGHVGGMALIPASGDCFDFEVTAHELGHALGLQHDFRGGPHIMSYHSINPIRDQLSRCAAEWLNVHHAFNSSLLDKGNPTEIKMLPPFLPFLPDAIGLRFKVSDPDGLHQAQLMTPTLAGLAQGSDELLICKSLNGSKNAIVEFIITDLTPNNKSVSLYVIDQQGDFIRSETFPLDITTISLNSVVIFPDTNLRLKVVETLGKPNNAKITSREMLTLTTLNADNAGINEIEGLQYAYNLTTLTLNNNNIVDADPLASLTQLTTLSIDNNDITDVAAIGFLQQLETLSLENNKISDIVPVMALTELKTLHLKGNLLDYASLYASIPVIQQQGVEVAFETRTPTKLIKKSSSTRGLAGSTSIVTISVQDENGIGFSEVPVTFTGTTPNGHLSITETVTDWNGTARAALMLGPTAGENTVRTSVPEVPQPLIFTITTIDGNTFVHIPDEHLHAKITDTLGISRNSQLTAEDMSKLTKLEARNANIQNLTGIEYAYNLIELDLGSEYLEKVGYVNSNTVTNFSPLEVLDQLTDLDLSRCSLSDISSLANLTQLMTLRLSDNPISDITPLSGLTQLKELWLWSDSISDITPLSGLTQLEKLDFSYNSTSDITPLSGLTQLKELWLTGNAISDIIALSELTQLEFLLLGDNSISDITPLSGLTQLKFLWLRDNPISDITPLSGLTQLEKLSLERNVISDVSPLVALNLKELLVWGNPLSYTSINTHIPAMQAKGIEVNFENIAHPALMKISGDGQTGISGTPLAVPFVVEVQNERGQLMRDVPVTFTIHSGGGILSPTTTKTDADGKARATLRLGWTPGTTTIRATADGLKGYVLFKATTTLLTDDRMAEDVNADGVIDVEDLVLVAASFGAAPIPGVLPDTDVNGDGVVNNEDVTLVLAALEATSTPAGPSFDTQPTVASLQHWIAEAKRRNTGDATFQRGILILEQLLVALTPKETALLPNYPNPFNPETWIPYQLAASADITISIYSADGKLVRTLALGTQPVGIYESRSRAAYWDGRNALGEPVASGIYFYTLTADDFTATRKMLIRK